MTEKLLQFSTWLGVRCEATEGDNVWYDNNNESNKAILSSCPTATKQNSLIATFPSFSLDHATHFERNNNDSRSKEEIQKEASSLLSSRMSVDVLDGLPIQIPRIILSNLYSSFDKLVDARILAFSKILRGHGLTLVQSSGAEEEEKEEDPSASARVLQFKLQTLLEVGTSISADAVTTTVLPTTSTDGIKIEKEDGSTIIIPISLKVKIDNLHLTCAASGDTAVLPAVIFEAPGTIKGTFNRQNLDILETVDVDVDCKTLLHNMIDQASEVVAKTVDLANSAWEKVKKMDELMPAPQQKKQLDTIKNHQVVSPDLTSVFPSKKRPLPLIPLDLDVRDDTDGYLDMKKVGIGNQTQNIDSEGSIDRNLSAEDASAIVDYVICQIDTDVLAPHVHNKRQRTTASN